MPRLDSREFISPIVVHTFICITSIGHSDFYTAYNANKGRSPISCSCHMYNWTIRGSITLVRTLEAFWREGTSCGFPLWSIDLIQLITIAKWTIETHFIKNSYTKNGSDISKYFLQETLPLTAWVYKLYFPWIKHSFLVCFIYVQCTYKLIHILFSMGIWNTKFIFVLKMYTYLLCKMITFLTRQMDSFSFRSVAKRR